MPRKPSTNTPSPKQLQSIPGLASIGKLKTSKRITHALEYQTKENIPEILKTMRKIVQKCLKPHLSLCKQKDALDMMREKLRETFPDLMGGNTPVARTTLHCAEQYCITPGYWSLRAKWREHAKQSLEEEDDKIEDTSDDEAADEGEKDSDDLDGLTSSEPLSSQTIRVSKAQRSTTPEGTVSSPSVTPEKQKLKEKAKDKENIPPSTTKPPQTNKRPRAAERGKALGTISAPLTATRDRRSSTFMTETEPTKALSDIAASQGRRILSEELFGSCRETDTEISAYSANSTSGHWEYHESASEACSSDIKAERLIKINPSSQTNDMSSASFKLSNSSAARPTANLYRDDILYKFLDTCVPSMIQYYDAFYNFGCISSDYLKGISKCNAQQIEEVLRRMPPGRSGIIADIDLILLRNHFQNYKFTDF